MVEPVLKDSSLCQGLNLERQVDGGGRPYWRQRPPRLENQELEEEKIFMACLARMLTPSFTLQSWLNKEIILKCSKAGRGRQPARKYTTGAWLLDKTRQVIDFVVVILLCIVY